MIHGDSRRAAGPSVSAPYISMVNAARPRGQAAADGEDVHAVHDPEQARNVSERVLVHRFRLLDALGLHDAPVLPNERLAVLRATVWPRKHEIESAQIGPRRMSATAARAPQPGVPLAATATGIGTSKGEPEAATISLPT
jgi:hypothetical protein